MKFEFEKSTFIKTYFMDYKICNRCKTNKSRDQFYTRGAVCKSCTSSERKEYTIKNRDYINARVRNYCKINKNIIKQKLFDKRYERAQQRTLYRRKIKYSAFDAYGGRICSYRKEDDINALTIDHINNDEMQHRLKLGNGKKHQCSSNTVYTWLMKNNYPNGFQVLCANCNLAKLLNKGILPENRKNKYLKSL